MSILSRLKRLEQHYSSSAAQEAICTYFRTGELPINPLLAEECLKIEKAIKAIKALHENG